jgi:hypothetical protein
LWRMNCRYVYDSLPSAQSWGSHNLVTPDWSHPINILWLDGWKLE